MGDIKNINDHTDATQKVSIMKKSLYSSWRDPFMSDHLFCKV